MKKIISLLSLATVLGLFLGCATLHKSDSAILQGTWVGQEVGRNTPGECSLIVSGNNFEFRGADSREWYKGTFALRPEAQPRQLIGNIADCPAPQYVGKTVNAIYRIEGDTLIFTGNEPGNPEMPAAFEAPRARQFVLKKK